MKKSTIVIILAAIGTIMLACSLFGMVNDLNRTRAQKEIALSAQYSVNQNTLSNYISSFYEKVGVAKAGDASVAAILTEAVKGRYDKDGIKTGGALFVAIAEAYPDVKTNAQTWQKIQDWITTGRLEYKNSQDKLLDMLRAYDTWRREDLVRGFVLNLMGTPSQDLVARIGTNSFRGRDALDKMWQIVLTGDTLKAYDTGVLDPLKIER